MGVNVDIHKYVIEHVVRHLLFKNNDLSYSDFMLNPHRMQMSETERIVASRSFRDQEL